MDSELIAWRVEAGRFADVRLMAELQKLARVDRRSEARHGACSKHLRLSARERRPTCFAPYASGTRRVQSL